MILAVLLTSQASGFSLLPEPASVWDSASDRGFTIDGESNPRLRYVPGAETTLWFEDLSFSGEERWQIRSLDESIFQIGESSADSDGGLWAEGHAVGVGETFLYVERNEGRYPIPISVLLPDRVALTAPLLGDAPVEGAPLLLTRAGATFTLEYHRGEEQLYGAGAVSAEPAGEVEIAQQVADRRDQIRLYPTAPGRFEIDLRLAQTLAETLTFEAVEEDAIADLALSWYETGRRDSVVALAFDSAGTPIYGAEPRWWFLGRPRGTGERFAYRSRDVAERELTASIAGVRATTTIRARTGSAESSSAACTTARGAAGWPVLAALFGLLRRRGV